MIIITSLLIFFLAPFSKIQIEIMEKARQRERALCLTPSWQQLQLLFLPGHRK